MIAKYVMTGWEVKIDGIHPGVGDRYTSPDFDDQWVNEQYGNGHQPQINIMSDCANTDAIYIAEITGASSNQQLVLYMGNNYTFDYNLNVRVMNEFYAIGQPGDILTVICR